MVIKKSNLNPNTFSGAQPSEGSASRGCLRSARVPQRSDGEQISSRQHPASQQDEDAILENGSLVVSLQEILDSSTGLLSSASTHSPKLNFHILITGLIITGSGGGCCWWWGGAFAANDGEMRGG